LRVVWGAVRWRLAGGCGRGRWNCRRWRVNDIAVVFVGVTVEVVEGGGAVWEGEGMKVGFVRYAGSFCGGVVVGVVVNCGSVGDVENAWVQLTVGVVP